MIQKMLQRLRGGVRGGVIEAGKCLSRRVYTRYYSDASPQEATALQMLNYVRQHSYPLSANSYQELLRVMEQGLSVFSGSDAPTANATGRLLLGMSTLYRNRGELKEAEEKLEQISKMESSSLEIKVAASEALAGVYLQMYQDSKASDCGERCLHLLESTKDKNRYECFTVLELRAKATKGLAELASGDINSAARYFTGWDLNGIRTNEVGMGAAILGYAEFLHLSGNLSLAKKAYEIAVQISQSKIGKNEAPLAGCNMAPEEVHLGAACGLGQLATDCGLFEEAEQQLTEVLGEAEKYWGEHDRRVGIALASIAYMFAHKGKAEDKSYFLVQEGLYRRALDYLKSPVHGEKGISDGVELKDVTALTLGRYSQLLSQQLSRSGEAEKMREKATSLWKNPRMSLGNVLENVRPSSLETPRNEDTTIVTDIRLGRVF